MFPAGFVDGLPVEIGEEGAGGTETRVSMSISMFVFSSGS